MPARSPNTKAEGVGGQFLRRSFRTGNRATAEGRPYTRPLPLSRPALNTQGPLVGASLHPKDGLRAGPSPNPLGLLVGAGPSPITFFSYFIPVRPYVGTASRVDKNRADPLVIRRLCRYSVEMPLKYQHRATN